MYLCIYVCMYTWYEMVLGKKRKKKEEEEKEGRKDWDIKEGKKSEEPPFPLPKRRRRRITKKNRIP